MSAEFDVKPFASIQKKLEYGQTEMVRYPGGLADPLLYGTLNASLLFWKDLTGTIGEWNFGDDNHGFILNLYNSCVANCMINGKQCTILWHVDDLKISHEDPAVRTDII